jgi:ParB/RepB/Spo0J family partition protein
MIAQVESYELGRVNVCPLNPRKRIDLAGIEELAESIIEHGIIQPPIARPREKLKGDSDVPRVEIVFGQRRLLGAKRAFELACERKLPAQKIDALREIPVIVRPMPDRQVIEEAWVENLQRVDVSVREEAEGFAELLALKDEDGKPVYTQDSLALKLGKSKAFLSQRLKLKHVPESLWEALDEKRVSVRHLELVGTIADPKSREKAAKEILDPHYQTEPLSTREAAKVIEEHYRKSLKGVAWEAADAELVPVKLDKAGLRVSGGSCEDCPYRTGNVPELLEQGALSETTGKGKKSRGFDPRVCLQPACHRAKDEAHWKRLQDEAKTGGLQVLTAEEAKETFAEWGDGLSTQYGSPLVPLAAQPDYRATGHHGADDLPTWESYLEGTAFEKEVVVGRHPKTGAVLRLIDRERAIKLAEVRLKEKGEVSPFTDRPKPQGKSKGKGAGSGEKSGPQPLSEWQLERQSKDTMQRAALLKVREVVSGGGLDVGQLRALVMGPMLETLVEQDSERPLMELLPLMGYTMPDEKALEEGSYEDRIQLSLKECRFALEQEMTGEAGGCRADAWLVILVFLLSYEGFESASGKSFLGTLGIDPDAMLATAREQIEQADRERVAREVAELEAKKKPKEPEPAPAEKAPKAKTADPKAKTAKAKVKAEPKPKAKTAKAKK